MRCRFILLLIFPCMAATEIFGQSPGRKLIIFSSDTASFLPAVKYRKEHPDAGTAGKELRLFIQELRKSGYAEASADSVFERTDTLFADVHAGPKYVWEHFEREDPEDALSTAAGFREKEYQGKPFNAEELEVLRERILTFAENNGYPFASVAVDSLTMKNGKVQAKLHTQPGPFIVFDSIKLAGTTRLKRNFLINYTGIVPGKPFDKRKIEEAERLLKRLPYLKLTQPPAVSFENGKALAEFPAEQVKAGKINGIIGFMPNEQEPGKVLLTGDVHLKLENMFGSGKRAEIRWQRLKEASQFLNLEYHHPVLFGSALDLNVRFNLLKEDTLFLNVNRELGFRYRTYGFGDLMFHGEYKTSRVISSSVYENADELPEFSDTDLLSSGLGWMKDRTDDPAFPRRGYAVGTQISAGSRTVRPNALAPEGYYEGVPLKSARFDFRFQAGFYIPIAKNVTLLTRLAGGKIVGKSLFTNELFRVGGLQSLRGFNENYFFASDYATATAECRIYGQANMYMSFFYDQGYIRSIQNHEEFPLGFGAALGVSTKAGIFSLVWAFGQSEDQPLSINRSKIHFGITGQF